MRPRTRSVRQPPPRPSPVVGIRLTRDAGHRERPAICGVIDAIAIAVRGNAAAHVRGATTTSGMATCVRAQALAPDGRPAAAKAH